MKIAPFTLVAAVTLAAGCSGPPAPATDAALSIDAALSVDAVSSVEAGVLFADDFESFPTGGGWSDGTTHGGWSAAFDGFGTTDIEIDGTHALCESPMISTVASETHASLVVTHATFGDATVALRMRTVSQLRTPTPNAWEVAWVVWRYTDDLHFYYLTLKANGWELGKEDPAYPGAQRFLASGSTPAFPIGPWRAVVIRQVGATIDVSVDGVPLVTFTDTERPYASGAVGLYNEDSHVCFDDVVVTLPR